MARIKGRRGTLVRDWQPLLVGGAPPGTTEEAIWGALLRELEWLFDQMDRRLRRYFAPMFLLFELKTIVLCLRNKAVANRVAIDTLLERSLLADRVRQVLHGGANIQATIRSLIGTMSVAAEDFRELGAAYAEEGLKGFEDSLMRVYLEHAVGERLHPIIRTFFVSFIDLRNSMILYKHLRWDLADGPPFIAGGSVPVARFRETLERKGQADFERLIRQVAGIGAVPVAVSEAALETVLLTSMTRELRKIGREGGDVGLILDYLWRVYVQARNLAVLHHGKGMDSITLEKELIL